MEFTWEIFTKVGNIKQFKSLYIKKIFVQYESKEHSPA